MSCLYILEINPLSVASFENIFSHSKGCFFTLFMDSFAVQKLLSLTRSHLFIFVFIFITLGGGSKKILLWFMSKSVLSMFPSKSFIVSGLTFRSLIHFEFIFVYDVRKGSHFILLYTSSVQFTCSVVSNSLWPMNRSTPGLPVHHQLPEFTQTHIHWVGGAIQPSHPLSSPSPPALNLSQHQALFKWVSSSHQVAKVLEFQLQN